MDYIPIIYNALKGVWWVIPVVLIIGLFKLPWFKGVLGEALVKLVAMLRLPADTYHPLQSKCREEVPEMWKQHGLAYHEARLKCW